MQWAEKPVLHGVVVAVRVAEDDSMAHRDTQASAPAVCIEGVAEVAQGWQVVKVKRW